MALTDARRHQLHRRAMRLKRFAVTWNVVEAVVAIGADLVAGSIAPVGLGFDSVIDLTAASARGWRRPERRAWQMDHSGREGAAARLPTAASRTAVLEQPLAGSAM